MESGLEMTDRERLLTALLSENERGVGETISVLDVIGTLDTLSAVHRCAERILAD